MNLHDWIDELSDALDIEIDLDETLVLDMARDVAHNVDRPAAPLSTFLLGFAAGQGNGDPEEIERLADIATQLALRWDRPASSVATEDQDPEAEAEVDSAAGTELDEEYDD